MKQLYNRSFLDADVLTSFVNNNLNKIEVLTITCQKDKFYLFYYYKDIMIQEEVKNKMQEGFAKIQPKVAEMTNIIMDAYQKSYERIINRRKSKSL